MAVLVVALAIFVLVLPHPVVLPVFSLWALFGGGLRCSSRHFSASHENSYAGAAWDMAGAFTLVGCAAAILGEIEPIIDLVRPSGPRNKAND